MNDRIGQLTKKANARSRQQWHFLGGLSHIPLESMENKEAIWNQSKQTCSHTHGWILFHCGRNDAFSKIKTPKGLQASTAWMALKQWGNFPNKLHIFFAGSKGVCIISDGNFGPYPTKSSCSRSALSLHPTGCNYPWTVFSVAVSVTLPVIILLREV